MENRTVKTAYALALALTLSVSATAHAQGTPAAAGMSQAHRDAVDTNKDGRVSEAEYRQFMENAFTKLDKDGNGRLSAAETAQVLTPEQFATVDKNKDGSLSRQEFMDQVMGDFRRQDRDGDGHL